MQLLLKSSWGVRTELSFFHGSFNAAMIE